MKEYKQLSPEAMTIKALSGELELAKRIGEQVSEWLLTSSDIRVETGDEGYLVQTNGKVNEFRPSHKHIELARKHYDLLDWGRLGTDHFQPEIVVERGLLDKFSNDQFKVQGRVDDYIDLIITLIPRS